MSARVFCKTIFFIPLLFMFFMQTAFAADVKKGEIPEDQLAPTYKKLPWGVPVWDVGDAVAALKKGENFLWVDNRPASFFKKGTVSGAVLLVYHNKANPENTLTKESLEKAIIDAGLSKESANIVFFCQGPQCHMSYNATQAAVNEWGYSPEHVVWFRGGYPDLLQEVKNNPKLKRSAKKYLSEAGVNQL
jgi:rhodanese-related sulfurtransferase